MNLLVLLILSILFSFTDSAIRLRPFQRYTVKGRLMCGQNPEYLARVTLADRDTLDEDDLMATDFSNEDGTFFLEGKTEEISAIDPLLYVRHTCYDSYPCYRKWSAFLPRKYITTLAEDPTNKTLDIGEINLEIFWHWEKRTCFNN